MSASPSPSEPLVGSSATTAPTSVEVVSSSPVHPLPPSSNNVQPISGMHSTTSHTTSENKPLEPLHLDEKNNSNALASTNNNAPSKTTTTTNNNNTNDNNNSAYGRLGYGGGYGAGGMMMDPYGMGGYGMGGYGMGGMVSPGMMMMSGMYGMSPDAQRAQQMMFMMSRVMEVSGLLSNAFGITCSSGVELWRSYYDITERVNQVESEYQEECHNYLVREKERQKALKEVPPELLSQSSTSLSLSRRTKKPVIRENRLSSVCLRALQFRILRYCVFLLIFLLCASAKTSLLRRWRMC